MQYVILQSLLSFPTKMTASPTARRHWLPVASTALGLLGACVMPCVRATAALLPAAGEVEGVDAGCLLGALYLLVSSFLLPPEILIVRRVVRKSVRKALRCVPPPAPRST